MAASTGDRRIGGSTLDIERGILRRADGAATTLRPKTLALLMLLHDRTGHLLGRTEILDTVWPEVTVTDDSITQCIVEIRRALGDDGVFLKTVPRRGYLLDLPIPGPPAAPATAHLASPSVPTVAVMPFQLSMHDPELSIFARGVQEGVVGALATLREPVVISASSTHFPGADCMDPRAIGERLGVAYVVAGTLRRAGASLRLTTELSDARTAAVIWQRPYDVSNADTFETQDRIAAIIANTLAPRVQEAELVQARRQRPVDLGAYRLLVQARQLIFRMERTAFEEAGRLLRRAIALDPDFPPTHATLADWHSLRINQGWSDDRDADARGLETAIDAALDRDASHPRALAMRGHNHTILGRRYADAIKLFERALDAAPNDAETWLWTSPTFAWMGDGPEAVRRAERALSLSPSDPLAFRFEHFLSIGHYASGNHAAAADWGLQSWRSNPNYTSNLRVTAAALAALGREAEARPLIERHRRLEPHFRVRPMIDRQAFRDDGERHLYGARLMAAGLPA